jgi:Xaa-Pro aminopeptidase
MAKNKLASISLGCSLLDKVYGFIKERLLPGKTEIQIKRQINNFLKKSGAEGFAFPMIVAFGSHTANIHHKPSKRKLTNNQIVMIDMGIKINGYCSDETRMFFVGKPKSTWVKTYNLVLSAQKKAISLLKQERVPAASLDLAARKFFPIPHSVGHGLGKVIHDNPKINPQSKYLIKPGDIFTIEPGRYIPGRFGARIEDSILKTKSGFRLLTKFPKRLKSVIIK